MNLFLEANNLQRRVSYFEKFIYDERACYKKCKNGFKCEKVTRFFELLELLKKCIQPSLFDDYENMKRKVPELLRELQEQANKIKDCYHVRRWLQEKGYSYFYPKRD